VLNKILGKKETQQARIHNFERKTHICFREKLPCEIMKVHGCHNFLHVILNNSTLLYLLGLLINKNIIYIVNFGLLKGLKLTIDHLEVGKLKRNFDLGTTK
jgi:hypothetical protein